MSSDTYWVGAFYDDSTSRMVWEDLSPVGLQLQNDFCKFETVYYNTEVDDNVDDNKDPDESDKAQCMAVNWVGFPPHYISFNCQQEFHAICEITEDQFQSGKLV